MAYPYFTTIIGKSLNYIVLITNILYILTTGSCKCIMSLNDEGNKMQEEGKDVIYMEKKWPAYIAIVIICIPLFVVLGYAETFSMNLLLFTIFGIVSVIPLIQAWVIGYMDDVKSFAENFKDPEIGKDLTYKKDFKVTRAILYPIIVGVLLVVFFIVANVFCVVMSVVMSLIIAVKVKGFVGEYKEMKEMINSHTDDQDNVE